MTDHQFPEIVLGALANMRAAGHHVDESEFERARAGLLTKDPACWWWPAPLTCTFADDDAAEVFLMYWHAGCCAICGSLGNLVKDHDHQTGMVRGMLCIACNSREGHAGPEHVTIAKYRERNPASILGIRVLYFSSFTGYAEPQGPEGLPDRTAHKAAVEKLSHRLSSPEDLQATVPAREDEA